ncbi:hypothetical protein M2451_002609 [Dysgonomonas sp. PFB1-18]|uniref:hypothetical protein n=1 Tax=unclassified Dysgonomonas TaxID=2630389 RepID=UPI002472F227|nr:MULTISPECIES: hypothetical protein [unclassified Dysgonomonas]MDH6308090.1 hypothetical protein [Dysgonomonas sp. PF1-14]MDH6339629.1 hypothetical protein [Dysgonomonas sp. PF1-16]MDH6381280.1 hypothetical protein [Dysgonomonas sp. PFB1-18]MDH6398492.1 hypothetical protein [Dysgonomonas sp. PF1-23]
MKRVQTAKELDAFIKNKGHKNIGYMHQRMKYDCEQSRREKALARAWRKDNLCNSWKNSGFGVLQDLFINTEHRDRTYHFPISIISKRDRVIAATVIQWLGSNCGFSWLCDVMKRCGYKITKIN